MKRDLLNLTNLSKIEIETIIENAVKFKNENTFIDKYKNKVLGLIFEKESTRTRISFEVAMHRLGGKSIYMGRESSQLSRGESYSDTASVLSRYLDAIVLRTYSQEGLEELASSASIPVINGLTDLYHPCQILADLSTMADKKIDLHTSKVCYVGDGNNMAHSWIIASSILGFHLHVATPKGYEVDKSISQLASNFNNIIIDNDANNAVKDASVIYTDTWFSMGQERTSDKEEAFNPFQVNSELVAKALKNVIVMHCLPAHRGEEITDDVMDGEHSVVFDEAEMRLYAQMALLDLLLR